MTKIGYFIEITKAIHRYGFDSKRIKASEFQYYTSTPELAYIYALHFIEKRWPEGEVVISKDARMSYTYALIVIQGPFTAGEPAIAKSPKYSQQYAYTILGDRNPTTWAQRYLAEHKKK